MFLAATFVISYDLSFVWSIYFIEKAQVVADNIFAVFFQLSDEPAFCCNGNFIKSAPLKRRKRFWKSTLERTPLRSLGFDSTRNMFPVSY